MQKQIVLRSSDAQLSYSRFHTSVYHFPRKCRVNVEYWHLNFWIVWTSSYQSTVFNQGYTVMPEQLVIVFPLSWAIVKSKSCIMKIVHTVAVSWQRVDLSVPANTTQFHLPAHKFTQFRFSINWFEFHWFFFQLKNNTQCFENLVSIPIRGHLPMRIISGWEHLRMLILKLCRPEYLDRFMNKI